MARLLESRKLKGKGTRRTPGAAWPMQDHKGLLHGSGPSSRACFFGGMITLMSRGCIT